MKKLINRIIFELHKQWIHFINSGLPYSEDFDRRINIGWANPEYYYWELVEFRPFLLESVPEKYQTVEMCISALEHDIGSFAFIKIHSTELYRRLLFGMNDFVICRCVELFGKREYITFEIVQVLYKYDNDIDLDKFNITDDEKEYLRLI